MQDESIGQSGLWSQARWWRILALLVVCALGAHFYNLEDQLRLPQLLTFFTALFMLVGFVPRSKRGWLILASGHLALIYFFGWMSGLLTIAGGWVFIGLLVSKISSKVKLSFTLVILTLLALGRGEVILTSVNSGVFMLLGAFFMFKVFVYLYDLKNNKLELSLDQVWNYFFMLPNYILFIFPIVDSKMWQKSYNEGKVVDTMETGGLWLLRGLYLLFLYRILYYYVIPAPSEIDSWAVMYKYHIVNYLLVFRLIGFFFISAGILSLMGHDIPKVFNNMFLANSFSDLWRRLNIYWKDYLMKLLYFPLYFKFRKKWIYPVFSIVLIVFVINWFMHGYQWFWILGSYPMRDTDVAFWAVFGVLVAINSVIDLNKNRSTGKDQSDLLVSFSLACRILGMFALMTVLWTFWSSDSIKTWYESFIKLGRPELSEVLLLTSITMVALIGLTVLTYLTQILKIVDRESIMSRESQLKSFVPLSALALVVSLAPVKERLVAITGKDLSGLFEERLNKADEERVFEGYYEELIVGANITSRAMDAGITEEVGGKADKEEWVKLIKTGIVEEVEGLSERRLLPDQRITFKGKTLTSNEYGLRDRVNTYSLPKPDGAFRIAILGGSIEMGSGVADSETFENILEDSLNQYYGTKKIEIINFAISGIHLPQHVGILEERVLDFDPDVVFYFAHSNEIFRALKSFAKLMRSEQVSSDSFLEKIRKDLGISRDVELKSRTHAAVLIQEKDSVLYDWGMGKIDSICDSRNIHWAWVYLQSLGYQYEGEYEELRSFVDPLQPEIFDLGNVFLGRPREEYALTPWDRHPNALGHREIAKELFKQITSRDSWNKALDRLN